MGEISGDRFAEVEVTTAAELHDWLQVNHANREGIWLITYKKAVAAKYLLHDLVLDELVAHGWCDGRMLRVDDERVMQQVSPRRTQPWAKSYKDRADRLVAEGRMQPSGEASVAAAKASGAWDAMNDVDALIVPDDLAAALTASPPAGQVFDEFPPSTRRNILRWIASAKTETTRAKRIRATTSEARAGRRVASNG